MFYSIRAPTFDGDINSMYLTNKLWAFSWQAALFVANCYFNGFIPLAQLEALTKMFYGIVSVPTFNGDIISFIHTK